MSRCFYRIAGKLDPEERLEDAVLAKALHDVLGNDLTFLGPDDAFPEAGLHLGRARRNERIPSPLSPDHIRYGEVPAFLRFPSRDGGCLALGGAGAEVTRLHEDGRDAVVKSTLGAKHLVLPVPCGVPLGEALDAMVYSFCDRPPCLLVQERVDMRFERRFLFLDGELLTQSAVGTHLTPMSRVWEAGPGVDFEALHLETPGSRRLIHNPALTARMTARALEIAAASDHATFCMDLCLIGEDAARGRIEPIEWNPFQPGQLGLYGCDPRRIAEGVRDHLAANPDLYQEGRAAPPEQPAPAGADMDWTDFDA